MGPLQVRAGPDVEGFAAMTALKADAPGLGMILLSPDPISGAALWIGTMQASRMKPIE